MARTQQHPSADAAPNGRPEPIQGNLGATILGPRNVPLERQTSRKTPTISGTSSTERYRRSWPRTRFARRPGTLCR